MRGGFLPLPASIDPSTPEFVAMLNDRLRRLAVPPAAAASASGTNTSRSSSSPAPAPPGPGYVDVTADAENRYTLDLTAGSTFAIALTLDGLRLTNGDFEIGDMTGWTSQSPTKTSIAATPVLNGAASLQAQCDTGGAYAVYQDLHGLTVGKTYSVFAWVRCSGTSAAQAHLAADDTGGLALTAGAAITPAGVWQLLTVKYTVTATHAMRIYLCRNTGAGTLYFDNVSVGPIVLPPAGSPARGDQLKLFVDQVAPGKHLAPAFAGGSGGFACDVSQQGIDGTPGTRSAYAFTWHGNVWGLDSFRTGGTIT